VDPERIAQVIANLVHNAFKYTPEGGRIELTAAVEGTEVAIRIKDSGVGIAPDVLPRIFDMYMQGEKAPGTELKGLGVGLALVQQLVELHGGRVAAFTDGLQKGSEFVVTLPVTTEVPAQPMRQSSPSSPEPSAPSQSRRFLIVDDHRDAAEALRALLESSGHEVVTCYDGASAFQAAKDYQPQVVILDIGLPDVSGYEVASRLRESLPQVVLIALSGRSREETVARDSLFNHYMTKPVKIGELQKLLSDR
jgi:CheY-like chemotaxis protein